MRRLTRLVVAAAAWSCASPGTPPGGPEDFDGPTVTRVRPDTNAVNVRAGGVNFQFSEVVSERPQGASDLASLFLISPSRGMPAVSWRRTQITVSPRGGFKPNTTYSVTMLPGLVDLEGNADSLGRAVVFSTGPALAKGHVRGIVFDWLAEKVAARAFVEAFPLPTAQDSVRYLTMADSLGRFDLANVPPGRYLLRTSVDQNKNRILDPRELYDSATVSLTDSLRREMLTLVRDTLGPGIQTIALADSLTLRVTMDHPLDTALVIDSTRFVLKQADSSMVPIGRVLSAREYEKAREELARTKAVTDSLRAARVADSTSKADSTKKDSARVTAALTRRAPPPPPRREVAKAVDRLLGRDTAAKEPPPKPSIRAPITEIVIVLPTPLKAGTSFRLRAIDMRSMLRRTRSSERVFTTPKPKKLADSTAKDGAKSGAGRGAGRGGAASGANARVAPLDSGAAAKKTADTLSAANSARDSLGGRAGADSAKRSAAPMASPAPPTAVASPVTPATASPNKPAATRPNKPASPPSSKPAIAAPINPIVPAPSKPALSAPGKPATAPATKSGTKPASTPAATPTTPPVKKGTSAAPSKADSAKKKPTDESRSMPR